MKTAITFKTEGKNVGARETEKTIESDRKIKNEGIKWEEET